MTKQEAQELVNSWNGEDSYFLHQGEIYTEDDVYEAEDFIKRCVKEENILDTKIAFLVISIVLCIVITLIINQ